MSKQKKISGKKNEKFCQTTPDNNLETYLTDVPCEDLDVYNCNKHFPLCSGGTQTEECDPKWFTFSEGDRLGSEEVSYREIEQLCQVDLNDNVNLEDSKEKVKIEANFVQVQCDVKINTCNGKQPTNIKGCDAPCAGQWKSEANVGCGFNQGTSVSHDAACGLSIGPSVSEISVACGASNVPSTVTNTACGSCQTDTRSKSVACNSAQMRCPTKNAACTVSQVSTVASACSVSTVVSQVNYRCPATDDFENCMDNSSREDSCIPSSFASIEDFCKNAAAASACKRDQSQPPSVRSKQECNQVPQEVPKLCSACSNVNVIKDKPVSSCTQVSNKQSATVICSKMLPAQVESTHSRPPSHQPSVAAVCSQTQQQEILLVSTHSRTTSNKQSVGVVTSKKPSQIASVHKITNTHSMCVGTSKQPSQVASVHGESPPSQKQSTHTQHPTPEAIQIMPPVTGRTFEQSEVTQSISTTEAPQSRKSAQIVQSQPQPIPKLSPAPVQAKVAQPQMIKKNSKSKSETNVQLSPSSVEVGPRQTKSEIALGVVRVTKVQNRLDLSALKAESRTKLQHELSRTLKPGITGLKEYVSDRSLAIAKAKERVREQRRLSQQENIERREFVDYFIDCEGLRYIGILEQVQLDFEERCQAALRTAHPSLNQSAQALRVSLGEIAQVQPVYQEKVLMEFDYPNELQDQIKILPIDFKPKIIAIQRLHEYGIDMTSYWLFEIKDGKPISPYEIYDVGTQTLAELMSQIFSLLLKSCEYLMQLCVSDKKYKMKYSTEMLVNLFTEFRRLTVVEAGAIGESCGQVMMRIPHLKKEKAVSIMTELYSQVNFADTCLSRGLQAIIPLILYHDYSLNS